MKGRVAHGLSERIAAIEAIDGPAGAVAKQVRSLLGPGALKDLISGVPIGHALHPLLTDIPIGTWLSATILDLVGGEDAEGAADRLIGVGIVAYGPTALTGVSDWADSEPGNDEVRRLGIAHGIANVTALTLYVASLAARRRGRRGSGVVLGLAGAGALGVGGWLGGDLAYTRGIGVDQTAFDTGPEDWTPALDASMLVEGRPAQAVVGDVEVFLLRRDGAIHALADRCAHRGCSLHGGEVVGDCIECPCHGSRFRLTDGALERGPSTFPQPAYEAREQGGRIEVRAAG